MTARDIGIEVPACPAAAKRREHRRDTPQHHDARNARGLGTETQTTHHATHNDDSIIAM
jgi:hypothetical protein